MNILTLILIIMKTKEELLAVLQNLGLSFCISNPIQEGTWVFKFDKALDFMQKDSINTEIDYHFGYMVSWHKNWLTVYPEIQSQVLRNFRDTVDNVGEAHQAYFKTFTFREQKNLSPKQFIIRINFDAPATKKILKEICWKFQERNNTFCKVLTNNEFLIDCAAQVDIEALKKEQQEALKKKHYADECGKLSRRLDIPFINVLAMGTDEKLLERHLVTMNRAAGLIAAQDKSEKKLLFYQIFKGDKLSKEKAIKSLGIEIGNADVMRIDFSSLKNAFK